jgi:hypothetical protein
MWAAVVGYEGVYEVSDLGRVRSLDRIISSGHRRKGKLLRFLSYKVRYLQVMLSNANVQKCRDVHVLVLTAFQGERPSPEHEARHLNGVRFDNRSSNLAWGTVEENTADKDLHGQVLRGEAHTLAKLTESDVKAIRASKRPQRELAAAFGVSQTQVSRVIRGVRWAHL